MARNGPFGQAGARAPLRRAPAEHDPYTSAPPGQPASGWPPQQPNEYPDPPQHAQGYHFPPNAEADPQFGYAPQQGHQGQPPPFERYPAPHVPVSGFPGQHALGAPQQWGQPQDARNYDLGTYTPVNHQGYPPDGQQQHFQQGQDHASYNGQQQEYGDQEGDDYEAALGDLDDEPRGGRRGLMIVAALVGAIGLGGAMAYTYKMFFAGGGGRAPVVKALDVGPSKTKPETPGGKEFAYTDKKLLNRLDDDSSQPQAVPVAGAQDDRTSDDPNAPRRVRIIPIQPNGPNGQAPMVAQGPPVRSAGLPVVAVPGLTIDTSALVPTQPAQQRVQIPQSQALPPARSVQQAQPQQPVMVASNATAPQAVDAGPVVARKAAAHKNPVVKTREASSAAVIAATSGFVAVLSSQKSRMDALKAFADLQQKYGDVLASKTPDVQEANLGDKGVWYRAVVGPPGSRDAAAGVCSQLKTAGYPGCWVVAY
jgi:hypothetical protein